MTPWSRQRCHYHPPRCGLCCRRRCGCAGAQAGARRPPLFSLPPFPIDRQQAPGSGSVFSFCPHRLPIDLLLPPTPVTGPHDRLLSSWSPSPPPPSPLLPAAPPTGSLWSLAPPPPHRFGDWGMGSRRGGWGSPHPPRRGEGHHLRQLPRRGDEVSGGMAEVPLAGVCCRASHPGGLAAHTAAA